MPIATDPYEEVGCIGMIHPNPNYMFQNDSHHDDEKAAMLKEKSYLSNYL